jgi:tight adherence protein B
MRHRRARIAVAVGVAVASLWGGGAAAQPAPELLLVTAVDVTAAPLMAATVTAGADLAAVALQDGALTLTEGGVPVAAEITALPVDDLEIVLVIDTSGSMAGEPLAAAKEAARRFLALLPAGVRVGVVGFGASATSHGAPTADRAAVLAAVDALGADGQTALYDALVLATTQFSPGARRSVVVLSDGGDTASAATVDDAAARLAEAGARLDAVALPSTEEDGEALTRLAAGGGGRLVAAADPSGLAATYDDLAVTLARQYRLTWTTAASGPVDVALRVEVDGWTVGAAWRADVPVTTPTSVAPPPAPTPPVDPPVPATWPLPVGGTLLFAALVLLGVPLATRDRRPVSRGRLGGAVAAAVPSRSAVGGIADRAAATADRVLEDHGRRRAVHAALDAAGIALRPGEVVTMVLSAMVTAFVLGSMLGAPVVGLALAGGVALAAVAVIRRRGTRRRAGFGDALGETLQLMSGSLRAGYALLQAVDGVAREAADPVGEEFRRVLVETRLGRDLSDALHQLAGRMRSDDFEWVVQAIDINREVGGDLAEVLDTVAATIRERVQLQRQVRALSAEGRASAWVLTALPVGLFGLLRAVSPEYAADLTHGGGLVALVGAAVSVCVGGIVLRNMCRFEI